jgi:MFS family permease
MLSTGLVAIDSTVLAMEVPSIVGELGGFNQFPWLFSAYLLGQAVTTPIYAKLSDIFGRKPILPLGIALFLAGSILCALACSPCRAHLCTAARADPRAGQTSSGALTSSATLTN